MSNNPKHQLYQQIQDREQELKQMPLDDLKALAERLNKGYIMGYSRDSLIDDVLTIEFGELDLIGYKYYDR